MPKAETIHGEVEYDTVTCCSCDNEVLPENTKEVIVIQDEGTKRKTDRLNYTRYELYDDKHEIRNICSYCTDQGPLTVPDWLVTEEKIAILLFGWATLATFALFLLPLL